MISMVVVPVVVLPLILNLTTRLTGRMEQNAEEEAKTMGIARAYPRPPSAKRSRKTGTPGVGKRTISIAAVEDKKSAAAVEEIRATPPVIQIFVDSRIPR